MQNLTKAIRYLADCIEWGTINGVKSKVNKFLNEGELDQKLDKILESSFSIRNNPLELKDWELNKIKQMILYCKHRLSEHHSSGIRYAIDLKTLNKILKKFI